MANIFAEIDQPDPHRDAYESGRRSRDGEVDVLTKRIYEMWEMQDSLTDEIRILRGVAIEGHKWQRLCEAICDCFAVAVDGRIQLRPSHKGKYRSAVWQIVQDIRRWRREHHMETDEEIRERGGDPDKIRRELLEAESNAAGVISEQPAANAHNSAKQSVASSPSR